MGRTRVTPSRKQKTSKSCCITRRSVRIQNSVLPTPNHGVDYEVHEINGSESEKEDGINGQPESNSAENTSEEKIGIDESGCDKIHFELLLAHENISVERISKNLKRSSANGGPNRIEIYKNLYIDAQKKIQALKSENVDLVRKLENALGKLDTYEKMGFPKIIEKLKEVLDTNSYSRAGGEAVAPLKSHQPKEAPKSGVTSRRKRKRIDKTTNLPNINSTDKKTGRGKNAD